jgi:hypothetical protein
LPSSLGSEYGPRKHIYEDRQFLYVSSDSVLCESTAETFPRGELPYRLPLLTERLIACNDSAGLVKELDEVLSSNPSWSWNGTPLRRVKRSALKPPDQAPTISSKLHISRFGFRDRTGGRRNLFYQCVDCVCITGVPASHNVEQSRSELDDLVEWANAYREFCRENGVRCTNNRGSTGSAMLRDPRFVGLEPRRKIPEFINETARKHLPGNHYDLRAPVGKQYNAVYLDLESAHHNAAKRATFPSPASLRGRGNIERKAAVSFEGGAKTNTSQPWARFGTTKYEHCIRQHGLFNLSVDFSEIQSDAILPPWARKGSTTKSIWVYSNELELLDEIGARIIGIICCYTSPSIDDSLNRYGEWASEYLSRLPLSKRNWIKPILLSTYGMLAKRSEAYQHSNNLRGRPVRYPTSEGWLEGRLLEANSSKSPQTNNIIARGIIEAEVRKAVINYGRLLQDFGVEPLALYADSLIAPAGFAIPIPDGWTLKTDLTGVIFYNPVSFSSREIEKMPGVDRTADARRARIRQIRASVGQGHRLPSGRLLDPSGDAWDNPTGKRVKRQVRKLRGEIAS